MSLRTSLLTLLTLPALVACFEPPECKPAPVKLPAAEDTLAWVGAGYATVTAKSGALEGAFVLDTGFSQSAVTQDFAQGVDPFALTLELGATQVGPMVAGVLAVGGIDGVIGSETLHQLPLRFDPLSRTTDILPAFESPLEGAAPLTVIAPNTCREEQPANEPGGPFAFLVRADVEEHPVTFLLDTGASATFLRTEVQNKLTGRPTLSNIRIGSGFSGGFEATATRAKELAIANGVAPNQVVIAAAEVDQELDRLSALLSAAKPAGFEGELRIDGFLGWTFLREFKISMAEGTSPTSGRTLSLQRYGTQFHWQREFLGLGIYSTRPGAAEPDGIKVDGFLSVSPAKDAGLLQGDILTAVDGVALTADSTITFAARTAKFTYQRNEGDAQTAVWVTKEATIGWADLLPNPPL